MREVFHQSLEDVQNRLVEISGMVTTAIEKATTAFKTSDVALAEEVIAADAEIDDTADWSAGDSGAPAPWRERWAAGWSAGNSGAPAP